MCHQDENIDHRVKSVITLGGGASLSHSAIQFSTIDEIYLSLISFNLLGYSLQSFELQIYELCVQITGKE